MIAHRKLLTQAVIAALSIALVLAACGIMQPTESTPQPTESTPQPTETDEAAPDTLPAPEVTNVRFGIQPQVTVAGLSNQITNELNLYENYGLEVEILTIGTVTDITQALQAGQIDIGITSGGPAVASLNTDEPLVAILVQQSNLTDLLVARAGVESADDLRGQVIAVSGFGGSAHASVLLSLEKLGLTADDVNITAIGGRGERLAAIQSGAAAAAPLAAEDLAGTEDLGFNILVDLREDSSLGQMTVGLVTTRAYAEENPNTVLAFVAAHLEGLATLFHDPATAASVLAEQTEIELEEAAMALERAFEIDWQPRDGRARVAWFELHQELLASVDPIFLDVDPSQAFTNEFLDQLEELGLFDDLGVPWDLPSEVPVD